MGITISSKRYSCDMGYGGFGRFRNVVAEQTDKEFCEHYLELSSPKVMILYGDAREKHFKEYNVKTEELINQNKITVEVANFLYQSDCGGNIDRKQAKEIYELIKDCDDELVFGYIGRNDCAKMLDMKKILSDKTKVEWH